jgi:hypothetical protein
MVLEILGMEIQFDVRSVSLVDELVSPSSE